MHNSVSEFLMHAVKKGIKVSFEEQIVSDEMTMLIVFSKDTGSSLKEKRMVILYELYDAMKGDGLLIILNEMYKNFNNA